MDIKPDMMKCVKTDSNNDAVYRHQYRHTGDTVSGGGGDTTGYLPTSTAPQTWSQHTHQYSTSLQQQQQQQMSLGVAASTVPYSTGYCSSQRPEIITGDVSEFREGEDDSNLDLKTGREEIGHYDNDMISQTGPIRGYPSRADGFVWRPY